jgi:hypothetical protein
MPINGVRQEPLMQAELLWRAEIATERNPTSRDGHHWTLAGRRDSTSNAPG